MGVLEKVTGEGFEIPENALGEAARTRACEAAELLDARFDDEGGDGDGVIGGLWLWELADEISCRRMPLPRGVALCASTTAV